MQSKLFGMISLSRKAGKLIGGFDQVKEAVYSGEAELVFYSSDLSERTKSSMDRVIEQQEGFPPGMTTRLTMYDYGAIYGKPTGVLALTDAGFASAVEKLIAAEAEI